MFMMAFTSKQKLAASSGFSKTNISRGLLSLLGSISPLSQLRKPTVSFLETGGVLTLTLRDLVVSRRLRVHFDKKQALMERSPVCRGKHE